VISTLGPPDEGFLRSLFDRMDRVADERGLATNQQGNRLPTIKNSYEEQCLEARPPRRW
jgi:hypothetical protein